jgi:anti-sigma factor RsiW
MDCNQARGSLLDLHRDRLAPEAAGALRDHLAACAQCRHEGEAEALLDQALRERLPPMPASAGLRERVGALARAAEGPPAPRRRRSPSRLSAGLAAACAVLAVALVLQRRAGLEHDALDALAGEAVSDHLRVLASAHPLDLESSAHHEVKPWFEGRLDFAPEVPPDGGELRLLGGSVGYVLDQKAAVVSYALRRHRVTLLAFPASGLRWPDADRSAGGVPAREVERRGFHVVLWRSGDLGYALVSDVAPADLERLAASFAPATR